MVLAVVALALAGVAEVVVVDDLNPPINAMNYADRTLRSSFVVVKSYR
jgi:hypothetical protein